MKIKTLEVAGIGPAIRAMRHPYASYDRSDTVHGRVGEKDRELSRKLAKAGPEHAKHLRMIQVWVDISAPRYWLTEMDTYRAGVEKVSCSTMHTIMNRSFDAYDFEHDDNKLSGDMVTGAVFAMNALRDQYLSEGDPDRKKEIWRVLIQNLPQSYLQSRTYMFSYAALRNIIRQRRGHKLKEWAQFIDWCRTLPESWMLFDEEEPHDEG